MLRTNVWIVAALLAVVLTGSAFGQQATAPLADKLPASSMVYVGWGGAGPNQQAVARTGLSKLLNDPEVKPHVDAMLVQLETLIKKETQRELPAGAYDPIRSLLFDVVWDRPWAAALVDVKLPGPQNPAPSAEAVLLVDLGDKADKAMADIDTLLTKVMPAELAKSIKEVQVADALMKSLTVKEGMPPILWGQYRKHLIVAVSQPAAEKVVALVGGKSKESLAGNAQFAKVTAKAPGGLYCVYADLARIRKDILPAAMLLATVADAKGAALAGNVISALGLDAIDAICVSARADGEEFVSSTYVLTPRGKPGLLVLADQKPVATELLAAIPADATFAIAGNFNRVKIIDELEKQLTKFPEAKAQFDAARKEVEQFIGLDLKKDVAEAVGDGVAVYNSPAAGGFIISGLTIVAEVKDAAKLKAALPKLEAALLKKIQEEGGPDAAEAVMFKDAKFKNYDYRYALTMNVPVPVAPAWCLTGKYLVVSTFPQTLKAALLQIEKGKDGSVLTNEWLGKQLAGVKDASLVSYVNQRQLLRIVYPAALPLWQVGCSMGYKAGLKLDVNALPRLDVLTGCIGDAFGAMIPDAEGVLCVGRSSTPLMSGIWLGNGITIGTAAFWAVRMDSSGRAASASLKAQNRPEAVAPVPAPRPQPVAPKPPEDF